MRALEPIPPLPPELERLTDPALEVRRVVEVVPLGEGGVMARVEGETSAQLYRVVTGIGRMEPVPMPADPAHLWPADAGRALALAGGVLWLVGPDAGPVRVTSIPDKALSVAAVWTLSGPVVAALCDCPVARSPGTALVYPAARARAGLWLYEESAGWRQLAEVAVGNGLSLSADGHRLAWVEPLSVGPEEAGRGEVRGFDVDRESLRSLTQGAGRLVDLKVAPDGSSVVYLANHQMALPITTHTDLWSVPWEGGPPRRLTGGDRCVDHWGWTATPGQLWVTCLRGMAPVSELLGLDGGYRPWPYPVPATSSVAWLDQGQAAFGAESREEYPGLCLTGVRIVVPQAEPYDDLQVTATGWRPPDGLEIEGLVYDTPRTSPDAPLLVQVHGGPAAPIEEARGEAVGYRHLLRAGYRVLKPAFRGSLGYGDRFSQANVGCQGRADLADILAGLDHLAAERCGILGRSYGGYMTLRALAVTRRFRAGVAISGFVDNRWMTLETGDLTYEREYLGPVTWPVPEAARLGDVFPHLGEIASPLLLIHGEADPICPLSQARVTYRAVQALGGQVGLVVYPGEGHRIVDPEHQRDCARRVLAFFREFLPVD